MSADEQPPTDGTQRLDKWLWFARVLKSRTLAAKLVSDGAVRLNKQRVEKPSTSVRAGDILTIGVHDRVRILQVAAAGVRRGPASEAQLLYVDLTPPQEPRPPAEAAIAPRAEGAGRPTKLERRQTDRLTGPDWEDS